MFKKLILCADDYGQNTQISEGILELAQMGRLSAVSCMVNGGDWPYEIEALKKCSVDIGLHLNFTHGQALTFACQKIMGPCFPGLFPLLAYELGFKKIDKSILFQEIKAQILKFKQDCGFFPDFIDGHQHVHQFSFIAPVLLEVVQSLDFKPWFRTTYTASHLSYLSATRWKSFSLYLLGGASFAKLLSSKGFRTHISFAGDYRFRPHIDYSKIFHNFLRQLPQGGLIMCHPGHLSNDASDKIANIRPKEFEYLKSPQFSEALQDHGFILSRFAGIEQDTDF
jgi:chitin disaccharide deacetylase